MTDAPAIAAGTPADRAARIRQSELAAFLRDVANRRGKKIAVAFAIDRISAALPMPAEGHYSSDALLGWKQPTEKKIARACDHA